MKSEDLRSIYIKYLVPTIGSMLLFSTYSMVDGIFVGRGVGSEALSAVNISMPFIAFIFAIGMLLSIGCSNLIGFQLGRRNIKEANEIFSIGIFLGATVGIAISRIAFLSIRKLAHILGANGELVDLVVEYLGVIIIFSTFYILTYMFEIMVKADGTPRLAIIFMIISALTNIILDYIFIFIIGWGLKGAAIATGISQLIPCVFYFVYFFSKYSNLKFKKFSISLKKLKTILTYGIPAALTELSTGATISFFNIGIAKYFGIKGLAAFSVIVYIFNFVVNAMISINQSTQPLVSYNLGNENLKNVKSLRKKQFFTVGVMNTVFFLIVQLIPETLVGVFLGKVDSEFLAFATKSLRIFSTSFLIIGFNIGIGGYLTSVKKPKYELIISILRGYVVVYLTVKFLPILFGKDFIWAALTVSEIITLLMSLYLLRKTKSKYREKMEVLLP